MTVSIVDVRADDLAGFERVHFFAGIGGWDHSLNLAGWSGPVWTGSCPCQPFSLAGAQKGFDDSRHLWPEFHRLIAERTPPVVFGEQVASAANWLGLVRGDLEALGYAVGCIPIQAASAGADHLRDRYWFVAADVGDSSRQGLAFGSISEIQSGNVRREGPAVAAAGHRSLAVADADQLGPSEERAERGRQLSGIGRDSTARDSGDVGHGRGPTSERDAGGIFAAQARERSARRIDGDLPNGSPDAGSPALEWVVGADGKARRVKSGIRLLAHGIPNRVGLLRGFGNAIDPRPAAEFIGAYMSIALSSQDRA